MALTSTVTLRDRGVFSDVDHELAEVLSGMFEGTSAEVRLGVAFASWAVQRGHVCASLAEIASQPVRDAEGEILADVELPDFEAWKRALSDSPLVGKAGEPAERPLMLDGDGRLYLTRYYLYESSLARDLVARASLIDDVDGPTLKRSLDRLLPVGADGDVAQRHAALLSLLHPLSVISGGPGTGKTYTVAKILIAIQEQARAAGTPYARIELLAPTGKAAQRLGEAIVQNLADAQCDPEIAAKIPRVASTIHRALGYQPRTPTRFRHDPSHPLQADVVIVDEASMVDAALMAKLVRAVRPTARLVLLGDRNQLASVEAGAILADLCPEETRYSPRLVAHVRGLTGDELPEGKPDGRRNLGDCVMHLVRSRRFDAGGHIAALAAAVNSGDDDRVMQLLSRGEEQIRFLEIDDDRTAESKLRPFVGEYFGTLGQLDAIGRLQQLSQFRFLCAHRSGPMGVETVNRVVEAELASLGAIDAGTPWYDGRPILVTANDYQISLFNGDVGVVSDERSETAAGEVCVCFPASDPEQATGVRRLPLGRLPPHETVFAMSVHKSQGSELSNVALLLPPRLSPVLTRELVYTAITRARQSVVIVGSESVLRAAVRAKITRASGLRARIDELAFPPPG